MAAPCCDAFALWLALPAALAVAACDDCAAPALFCAPALSPCAVLSTALCALLAVSSAFFAAFSNSPMALSAESRTFVSSGTLAAPVAAPLASFDPEVADSAAPVALCTAELAASMFSLVPLRSGSPRNSALFFSICSLAFASAASAFFTARSASLVSFSASTPISFSCSFTVSLAFW